MKTKKVLWGFLITIIMIGCSTDDFELVEEKAEVSAKNSTFLDPADPIGPGNPIDPDHPSDPADPVNPVDPVDPIDPIDRDLGMPVEAHSIYELGILTIKFPYGTHSFSKFLIREEFSEKYPSLRLVLVTDPDILYSPNIEYWLVKSNQTPHIDGDNTEVGNIDGTEGRDEDTELTDFPCDGCPDYNSYEHLYLINVIKQDIQNNDQVQLIN